MAPGRVPVLVTVKRTLTVPSALAADAVGLDVRVAERRVAQAVAERVGRRAGEVLVGPPESAGRGRGQAVVVHAGSCESSLYQVKSRCPLGFCLPNSTSASAVPWLSPL